jgi:hypothetical protein
VNVVALRALKRADIETHTCRRDANEDHVSAALWASRTMEVEVDIVRQEIGFLHDAFLVEEATYFGATNWPWSQSIVALDCIGSPSFTAVLS